MSSSSSTLYKKESPIQRLTGSGALTARANLQPHLIVARLKRFVLSETEIDPVSGEPRLVELSQTQVRAALGLLAKALPDLQTVAFESKDPFEEMSTAELQARAAKLMALIGTKQLIERVQEPLEVLLK